MPYSYKHFFDMMEDFGFFDHIYETLPEDFTAVFEIARILEDEKHSLTQRLLPALKIESPAAKREVRRRRPGARSVEPEPHR